MAFSLDGLMELRQPEVTTVIRWMLRAVLVVVLAWLVRRKPEPEEDEEEEEPQEDRWSNVRRGGAKARPASTRSMARLQPPRPRDPYQPRDLRQRRNFGGPEQGGGGGSGAGGGQVDFDAVIEKMSKPKDMWEMRKEGAPQILRHKPEDSSPGSLSAPLPGAGNASGPSALAGLLASVGHSGLGEQKKREPLKLSKPSSSTAYAAGKENMLHGHERPVTCITWNADGNLLFTCGKDKIVCVWTVPEGEHLGTYKGHNGAVWSCSVTSDSRWLVTSGADRLVIVWEARASQELARVELPGVVRCVEWADRCGSTAEGDSKRFATCHNKFGSHPAAVMIWQFNGTTIEQLLSIETLPGPANQVRWGGEQMVASAHENGELVFWRADTGAETRRLKAHDQAVSKFEFSQDGELVATVSRDMSVRIWDLAEGADFKKLYQVDTDRPLNDVALGPLTRAVATGPSEQRPTCCTVIAAGGQDARDVTTSSSTAEQFGTLLFKLGTGEEFPCELQGDGVTKGHFGPVHTLAFARDGSAIASGSEDGCVRLHFFGANGSASPAAASPAAADAAAPTPS